MSEQWQTGTPDRNGWWECELNRDDSPCVFWWNEATWYYDKNLQREVRIKVLRCRGPLVLATPPSQGARGEIVKTEYCSICGHPESCHMQNGCTLCGCRSPDTELDDRPFGQRLTDLEARVQRLEEKT